MKVYNKLLLHVSLTAIFIVAAFFILGINNSVVKAIAPIEISRDTENTILSSEETKLPQGHYINRETGQQMTVIGDGDYQLPDSIGSRGFIIQFEKKPVVIKKKELEKTAEANKEYVDNAFFLNPIRIFKQLFSTMPEDVDKKVKKYSQKLEKENKKIIEKILEKIGKPGADKLVMNKFKNTFNGIALDISKEESKKVKEVKGVKQIYPNLEVKATLMDSVPLINADDAWQLDEDVNNCSETEKPCLTGQGTTIAIIDTGIDYTHSDLGGCFGEECKVIGGYDFVNNDSDPMDDHGHGTHVAGIATGNGALKGVAPDALLYAYKVLNSGGTGSFDDVIAAVDRSVDPNQDGDFSDMIDVISLSLGGSGNPDDAVSQAIDNVVREGVVAVISAGNRGPGSNTIESPGTARKAITVGATYKKDYEGSYWQDTNPRVNQITSFSSRGPVEWDDGKIVKPDIVAPGAIICSARHDDIYPEGQHSYYYPCLDEEHVQLAGTSMSAPIVAGASALLKQKNPDWNSDEIKTALKNNAVSLGYNVYEQGSGLIDVKETIDSNKSPIAEIKTEGDVGSLEFNMDIIGTAKSENFQNYTLYYQTGEDFDNNQNNWVELYGSNSQVENNILYTWDISGLSERTYYVLKLVVVGNSQESVAYSFIKIVNTEIKFPKNLYDYDSWSDDDKVVFDSKERLEIEGTATGYNFSHYSIEWCDISGTCSSEGISLIDNGLEPIRDGLLGYWNISSGISSDYYYLKLNNNYNNQRYSHQIRIYVETELQTGWPKKIEVEGPGGGWASVFMRQPTIADINGDGKNDIIIAYGKHIYAYNNDGSFINGFPVEIQSGTMQQGPAVADIDNDGNNEIIAGTTGSTLHVLNGNGTYLEGWPKTGFGNYIDLITLEDINNDGNLEIIFGDWQGTVHSIDINGEYLSGWPKRLSTDDTEYPYDIISHPLSIADLDNDGTKEIIVNLIEYNGITPENKESLFVLDKDGNILTGWPRVSYIPLNNEKEIIVADINSDGNLEILFTQEYYIHALDSQGNELSGFPFKPDDSERELNELVIGDIDNDGILDIIFTSAYPYENCLYTYEIINENFNIKQGFPVCSNYEEISIYLGKGVLQLGNLKKSDNQIGIAPRAYGYGKGRLPEFFIFNSDGTIPNNFPKGMDNGLLGDSTPIGDIDNDGDNEIMGYTWSGNLYVWDLQGNSQNNEWPLYHHDPQHTGCYDCGPVCEDECSPEGITQCIDYGHKQICGNYDEDNCLEWGEDIDCGEDYCDDWEGNFCRDDDIFRSRNCYDRGCSDSECFDNLFEQEEMIEDCGEDSCGDWGDKYCKKNENAVYHSRSCNDRGCSDSFCFDNDYDEEEKVEDCPLGTACYDGECLVIGPYIKVLSPNGGEQWEIGQNYDIEWQSQEIEKAHIYIARFNENGYMIGYNYIGNISSSYGGYSWKIPIYAKYWKNKERSKIIISAKRLISYRTRDASDNYFSIVEAGAELETFCTNECEQGQNRCLNDNYSQTCGNYDLDQCLEWGGDFDCGGNYCQSWSPDYCENNSIYHSRNCYDRGCSDNACFSNIYTEEQEVQKCPAEMVCEQGTCVLSEPSCVDDCYSGQTRCSDNYLQTCGNYDNDSCLEWSSSQECPLGTRCYGNACTEMPYCLYECYIGQKLCDSSDITGARYQTCEDLDNDGCPEWGSYEQCPSESVCSAGECIPVFPTCEDECLYDECSADNTGIQVCRDYDSDGCLELGPIDPCPSGASCYSDTCIPDYPESRRGTGNMFADIFDAIIRLFGN